MRALAGWALLGCVLAAMWSSCGSSEPADRQDVRAAFSALARDLARGDADAACSGMTPTAARRAGWLTEVPSGRCAKRIRPLLRQHGPWPPRPVSVVVDGDRARVTAAVRRWRVGLPFVWDDGRWKADSLTGVTGPPPPSSTPARSRRIAYAGPITVPASSTTTTRRCPRVIVTEEPPTVEGGCALVATLERVAFRVLTLAGVRPLDACGMYFRIVLDNEGRAWMSKFGIVNLGPDGGCATSLLPCRWAGSREVWDLRELVPWPGSVERLGARRYRIVLNACFESRAGRFEGPVQLRVVWRNGRWTALGDRATIGASGLRLAAAWGLRSVEEWARVWGREESRFLNAYSRAQ